MLTGVRKITKIECPFSQMHLLRNNCATNVAQNFFANFLLLYLQAYIISWLSYLHGKTYKSLNLRNRLRGGMHVIFKNTTMILHHYGWLKSTLRNITLRKVLFFGGSRNFCQFFHIKLEAIKHAKFFFWEVRVSNRSY